MDGWGLPEGAGRCGTGGSRLLSGEPAIWRRPDKQHDKYLIHDSQSRPAIETHGSDEPSSQSGTFSPAMMSSKNSLKFSCCILIDPKTLQKSVGLSFQTKLSILHLLYLNCATKLMTPAILPFCSCDGSSDVVGAGSSANSGIERHVNSRRLRQCMRWEAVKANHLPFSTALLSDLSAGQLQFRTAVYCYLHWQ
jgi:hypothetical protein